MGSITANLMITANGVTEAPHTWQFAYFSPEMADVMLEQLTRSSGLVLGRGTFEEFAGHWPHVPADGNPMAAAINGMSKYVVSTTLGSVTWGPTEIINNNVPHRLRKLRESSEGDLSIIGSPTLVGSLLDHDVIDRVSLLVCPIVVDSGHRLFDRVSGRTELDLVHSDTLPNGVLHVEYEPADR